MLERNNAPPGALATGKSNQTLKERFSNWMEDSTKINKSPYKAMIVEIVSFAIFFGVGAGIIRYKVPPENSKEQQQEAAQVAEALKNQNTLKIQPLTVQLQGADSIASSVDAPEQRFRAIDDHLTKLDTEVKQINQKLDANSALMRQLLSSKAAPLPRSQVSHKTRPSLPVYSPAR